MNINFNDISEEEFDDNILNDIHIKKNDTLLPFQSINVWYHNQWKFIYINKYSTFNINIDIDKIELSDNITGNPYGRYNDTFKKIPNGEIIFSIKKYHYWFRYDKNIKIK